MISDVSTNRKEVGMESIIEWGTQGGHYNAKGGAGCREKEVKKKTATAERNTKGAIAMLRWRANAMDKRYAMLRESEIVRLM